MRQKSLYEEWVEKAVGMLSMKNRKGVFSLDLVRGFIFALMSIALGAFVIIVVMANLRTSNVLTTGSLEFNLTGNVLNNVSTGTANFFGNIPVWFSLLSLLVIIAILAVVLYFISTRAFQGGGAQRGA